MLLTAISPVYAKESSNTNVNEPYYSYTYDSNKEPVRVPSPYSAYRSISGQDLGIDLGSISDVFFDKDSERFFIADPVSNQIAVLNRDYSLFSVIDSIPCQDGPESLNNPRSICVRDGIIYIADTGNERIIKLSSDFGLIQVIDKPEISILGEYDFRPTRMAVDMAGRVYAVATGINDGIVLLGNDGEFIRFVGAPDVETTLWTKFLKLFMTKAQKQNLEKSVPTEYNSIVMDKSGFLYLTSADTTVHPITKLNTQGVDILKYENGRYPDGDSSYFFPEDYSHLDSIFVDIAVRDDGIYSALDTSKGRVFVYDQEGSLLYAFGGIGVSIGNFYSPAAIEIADDEIIVADGFYRTLTVFRRTAFGNAVETAEIEMLKGNYSGSENLWNDVLKFCPGYDAAYRNLARIDIRNGRYELAMTRLEGTGDISGYSKAFEGQREEFLEKHFYTIIIAVLILILLLIFRKKIRRVFDPLNRIRSKKLYKEVVYASYTMFHPFDGFWDLKREKRGSLAGAHILVVLFVVLYGLRAQFSGYIFTGIRAKDIDTVFEIMKMVVPLGLWIIANWCFTTLMDGEGTMRDIYIATAYSTGPYIVSAIPLLVLSNCLSEEEGFIYTTLSLIVMGWMLSLVFFSMIVTHDYQLGKGIAVAVLTILGICLILFLVVTLSVVFQKIYDFGSDIYLELMYRG